METDKNNGLIIDLNVIVIEIVSESCPIYGR